MPKTNTFYTYTINFSGTNVDSWYAWVCPSLIHAKQTDTSYNMILSCRKVVIVSDWIKIHLGKSHSKLHTTESISTKATRYDPTASRHIVSFSRVSDTEIENVFEGLCWRIISVIDIWLIQYCHLYNIVMNITTHHILFLFFARSYNVCQTKSM